jgi:hypothetical protein
LVALAFRVTGCALRGRIRNMDMIAQKRKENQKSRR